MASTPEEENTSIIKSDRIGRRRYSAHYKQEILAAFEKSSLSAVAFAEQCGVKYPTFASWVAKARNSRQSEADTQASPRFMLAEIGERDCQDGLEVRLPGGAVATANTAEQATLLAVLLKALD